jgi:hypothetical protein
MLKKAVITAFEILSVHFTGGTEEIHEEPDLGRLRDRNLKPAPPECDAGVRYLLGCFIGYVGSQPLYRVALCFYNSKVHYETCRRRYSILLCVRARGGAVEE